MKSKRLAIFWVVMLATIVFDQWIKAWVRGNLNIGQSWSGGPWHGVFEITLTYNKGIAFGMMQGAGLIMTPIALIIAGVAIRTIYKNANESTWGTIALGLLASGALGNLIDRLFRGKDGVTDMFLLRLSNITHGKLNDFPVFNVADSCISVAMVMLLISWSKQSAAEKEEPSLAPEPTLEDSSL
jgi:signal peptidase II